MPKHRGETHIITPFRPLFSALSSWGQEVMSRRRGHRNILVALISKCMSASVQVLQIEAPAALFLPLENHRLQTDASSSSSTSSRSSSFRPSRGRSRERQGSDTGHGLSLPLCFRAGSHQVAEQRRATCSSLADRRGMRRWDGWRRGRGKQRWKKQRERKQRRQTKERREEVGRDGGRKGGEATARTLKQDGRGGKAARA